MVSPPVVMEASKKVLAHKKGALPTTQDILEYEEFFRGSRKAAVGTLPDEWLIHLSDSQLQAAQAARHRILKEKAAAGSAAWKEWLAKHSNQKTTSDAGDGKLEDITRPSWGHASIKVIKDRPLISKEAR